MDSQPSIPVSDIIQAWPRRATKACANCRRDKIRCDGSRPCTSCLKKGYVPDQCIDGCEPCRRARVRCEAGKPCQRCREMQLDCVEDNSPAVSRQQPVLSISQPEHMKGHGSDRAKLACKNCRRDNKKCDDQRPCSRCVSRSEECVHVGRSPKLVTLRCEGCRETGKRCEEGRPCHFCVDVGKDCVTAPRKGRGHGTRVKAACMACRRDKIRCDGARPCTSCARKGYQCIERSPAPCFECGQAKECVHQNNGHKTPGGQPEMVQHQQLPGQGQPVQPSGFNQPIYPTVGFVQQIYVPGLHQPTLVQHSNFNAKQDMSVIDPSIGGSSLP